MTAPMKGEPAPRGAQALLRDASARAERLLAVMSAQQAGLPPDGLATWAQTMRAVERIRNALDDALRRADQTDAPGVPESGRTTDDHERQ